MTLDALDELLSKSDSPRINLVVGIRKNPGERVRLCGKSGPYGELLLVNAEGLCVANFCRKRLRTWAKTERKAGRLGE